MFEGTSWTDRPRVSIAQRRIRNKTQVVDIPGSNLQPARCLLMGVGPTRGLVEVAAGYAHTVLLRSDGRAVACGANQFGQCDVPEPAPGTSYRANGIVRDLIAQLVIVGRTARVSASGVPFGVYAHGAGFGSLL